MGAHILSAEHKLRRVAESQSLLTILVNLVEKNFHEIIARDEPRFAYLIESDAMFTSSPAEVIPMVHRIFASFGVHHEFDRENHKAKTHLDTVENFGLFTLNGIDIHQNFVLTCTLL
jgi:hypothetical protein